VPRLTRMLLTGDAVGGVWRYCLELAHGCAAEGVEPVLAVLGPPPSRAQLAEAAAVPGLRLIETGLPLDWMAPDLPAIRSAGAELAGLAARIGADTVHLHSPAFAAEVPWPVPVVAVAHSDVGTWWAAVRGGPLPPDFAWRAGAVARGLAEADVAVAPTRAFARALAALHRPGRRIEVVRNGRTPVPLAPTAREPIVLTAGRLWDAGKNVALLDRAAANIPAPVLAAGPLAGPDGTKAELTRVRPLGTLSAEEMAARMATATVFAAPSRYEPFGLAVLEAAQAGMALALADIPSFRELWEGAALFFHPDDAEQLAAVASRLLAAPAHPAARARERATRYSAEAMVAATLALHRPLVEGGA
jgi:glycosyltransferase involved in cell wall biosynthesis